MLDSAIFAIWFLLPAAVANVVPIVTAVLPVIRKWQMPMDFGMQFRGKPLLGPHKTWRGFISGVLAGWLTFYLLQLFARHLPWGWVHMIAQTHQYIELPSILGLLLGIGALGGDALKSFFKRQIGVVSGNSWIPFDQLDYIIGAVLISLPFVVLTVSEYIWVFIIWFGMHLLFSYLGFKWGLKAQPI